MKNMPVDTMDVDKQKATLLAVLTSTMCRYAPLKLGHYTLQPSLSSGGKLSSCRLSGPTIRATLDHDLNPEGEVQAPPMAIASLLEEDKPFEDLNMDELEGATIMPVEAKDIDAYVALHIQHFANLSAKLPKQQSPGEPTLTRDTATAVQRVYEASNIDHRTQKSFEQQEALLIKAIETALRKAITASGKNFDEKIDFDKKHHIKTTIFKLLRDFLLRTAKQRGWGINQINAAATSIIAIDKPPLSSLKIAQAMQMAVEDIK